MRKRQGETISLLIPDDLTLIRPNQGILSKYSLVRLSKCQNILGGHGIKKKKNVYQGFKGNSAYRQKVTEMEEKFLPKIGIEN